MPEKPVPKKQPKAPPRDKQATSGRTKATDSEPEIPIEVPVPSLAPPSAGPRGLKVLDWKGKPLYQCEACPFNSMKIVIALDHVAAKHGPQYVDTGLVGPGGGAIVKEV